MELPPDRKLRRSTGFPPDSEEVDDRQVEADLDEEVDDLEREYRGRVLDVGPDAVDDRVHGQPDQLRGPVAKHAALERRRNVHVLHVVPAAANNIRSSLHLAPGR